MTRSRPLSDTAKAAAALYRAGNIFASAADNPFWTGSDMKCALSELVTACNLLAAALEKLPEDKA